MKLPTGEVIRHEGRVYDPAKAHEYYLKNRKLKGRKPGKGFERGPQGGRQSPVPTRGPQVGRTGGRAQQKRQLATRINDLEGKLAKLHDLIQKKEAALKRSQAEAKKKPSASDKSKNARESKQYRQKHKAKLKAQAKKAAAKSGGGSSKGSKTTQKPKDMSIKDLKTLATKVKGQISVAKAKLSAL